MPYNTRRKSLSLPSLGIHVPVTHAARAASNRAASSSSSLSASPPTSATSDAMASTSLRLPSPAASTREAPSGDHRPSKKLKRAHSEDSDELLHAAQLPKKHDRPAKFDHTPPPSPHPDDRRSAGMDADHDAPATPARTIDLEGINDEIVEAVIVQLQNTDNRPHMVKELASILMQQVKVVQQSANPCAIVSSRLASYLKRPCWTALAPCPLAKELETIHPRRTYFYLTTCPHQPLPDPAHAAALSQLAHTRAITTPSLSSPDSSDSSISDDADSEAARRRELSPSPEVDLSSPEFDDADDDYAMPTTPIGSLSMRGFVMPQLGRGGGPGAAASSSRHHRAASPPLEKDEKEFTQTADGLQKRKLTGGLLSAGAAHDQGSVAELDFGHRDDGSLLFGAMPAALPVMAFMASPAIKPAPFTFGMGKGHVEADGWSSLDHMLGWDRSPENIELEELDGMLNGY